MKCVTRFNFSRVLLKCVIEQPKVLHSGGLLVQWAYGVSEQFKYVLILKLIQYNSACATDFTPG